MRNKSWSIDSTKNIFHKCLEVLRKVSEPEKEVVRRKSGLLYDKEIGGECRSFLVLKQRNTRHYEMLKM